MQSLFIYRTYIAPQQIYVTIQTFQRCPWFDSLSFLYQNRVVGVNYGQVKGREGCLGLVLGLVSSLEQYFRRYSMFSLFFGVAVSATLAPRIKECRRRQRQ